MIGKLMKYESNKKLGNVYYYYYYDYYYDKITKNASFGTCNQYRL